MVSIQLQDSVAAALAANAQAEGLSLQAYLERLAGAPAAPVPPSGDELERLFDEASVAGPDPSCTYTRADIYLDHD
ncbi:MAG: hypothetical protein WD845_14725 [Pirellulales bacterium]